MLHAAAIIKVGIAGGAATVLGAVSSVLGDAQVAPYVTGGGAITSSAVLALVAVKLARGELVARDPSKVEAALLRLVEERSEDHGKTLDLAREGQAREAAANERLERVLAAINRLEKP